MDSAPSLLLVDDDPLSLELLKGYLEPAGYRLTTALDGEAAWELLRDEQQSFDLVISDRSMPRLNGMDLLRRIKGDARLANLPVIFETSLTDQSDVAEGIAAGVWYYLTKPYNIRLLQSVVKAALDERRERKRLMESARQATGAIRLLKSGRFELRTLAEARELTALLATGMRNADSFGLGLSELLINAIEHGNLGISYREKSELLMSGTLHEEVVRRLNTAPWAERVASVEVTHNYRTVSIRITDQGEGFDPTRYMEIDPERAMDPNGRGIAMARLLAFSSLEYLGKGNCVVVTVAA